MPLLLTAHCPLPTNQDEDDDEGDSGPLDADDAAGGWVGRCCLPLALSRTRAPHRLCLVFPLPQCLKLRRSG